MGLNREMFWADDDATLCAIFSRVILDAPDVPTWFFAETVASATRRGLKMLHLYSPQARTILIPTPTTMPTPPPFPINTRLPPTRPQDMLPNELTKNQEKCSLLDFDALECPSFTKSPAP